MCAEPNQIPQASASPSDLGKKVQLVVTSGDTAAEIFVIDGALQLCARGIGRLDAMLAPGIYRVRIRTGFATQEEHVVLRDAAVSKYFPPLAFASPIPLANTAKSHEYHQAAAVEYSKQVQVHAGVGSSIFVFARDWTAQQASQKQATGHAAAGLKLKSIEGTVIADIAQSSVTSSQVDSDPTHDPWAACTTMVNPGAYRLSVETPEGEFEQTIVAPPNWYVHVFLLQRSYAQAEDKRPDLASAAITLSQTQQFTPNGDEARLVEMARLGLVEQRKVLSSDLRQMLTLKLSDPMLGIFAGHLILTDAKPDLPTLSMVVNNLRSLLQYPHPDVEALALRLDSAPVVQVNVPPMLRRSWSIILDASSDQKAMVMRGSLAADIVGRICALDPWLIWAQPQATVPSGEHEIQQSYFKQALNDQFARAERSASNAFQFQGEATAMNEPITRAIKQDQPSSPQSGKIISKGQVKQLIHSLGVPRFYLEDLLKDSDFKLSDE